MDNSIGDMTRGQRIKYARTHIKKIRQVDFGKKAGGVTTGAVSQWENDLTTPTAYNFFAIEDQTGFSARWLSSGEGPMMATDAFLLLFEKEKDLAEKLKTLSQHQIINIAQTFTALINKN